MKQNTIILNILIAVAALLTYSGTNRLQTDLIVSSTQPGYVLVREPMETHGRAFHGQHAGPGLVGTWVHSISTADYPSRHVVTRTLTLRNDGTALLVLEEKSRVGPQTENPQYETDTQARQGTWLKRGEEVWIDLEDLV